MVVRKILVIALLPLVCASVFSCKHSDSISEKSDINKSDTALEHPFEEGYYVGEDYTMQIVYTGNKTEHSYGVSLWDNETGAEEFFGLVYNVSPNAVSLTVPGYIDQSAMLFADKVTLDGQDCVVKITDLSENGVSAALCGEYKYDGIEWQPASAAEADIIGAGTYVRDDYTLIIEKDEVEMRFGIYDDKANELFVGSCRNGDQNTVTIGSEDSYCRFAKCQNGDGAYIDVSIVGYKNDCDYYGKYALVKNSE